MSFRITGLSPAQFRHLFGLPDEALAAHGARRCIADSKPGFPDRIEVRDVEPGESLLLLNYTHQPAETPYRASHAIFVREGAVQRYDRVDEIPEVLRLRLISLRAFDERDEMIDGAVTDGATLALAIAQMFADPAARYLHAHYASRGCYAARVDRA
ncbi:MAG: hypothetical protein JWN69_1680 [Alphaproteobacteria bacterium]|nr:hypothetical protein [Alphaproteobacteria bacterium]